MEIYRLRSYQQFLTHQRRMQLEYKRRQALENNLTPKFPEPFTIAGYSHVANEFVHFEADYLYGNGRDVNWRERLICPKTGLNNRIRASLHLFEWELSPYAESTIYVSEQVTPLFGYLKDIYPNLTGSEFLGNSVELGKCNDQGVRNEDLTNLTFADESFDFIMSFDCFEHFANFENAFAECFRVLKPRGKLLFSVPFLQNSEKNLIRAKYCDGQIVHLLEPEYHGDPLQQEGCLCFTHFGWEVLDQLRQQGFKPYVLAYWSQRYGYLGLEQFLFVAEKE